MFGVNFKKYKYGDTVPGGTFKAVNGIEFIDPLGNKWCFGCGTWRNFGNPTNRPRKPAPEPKEDDSFWYKDKITDEDIWKQNMH